MSDGSGEPGSGRAHPPFDAHWLPKLIEASPLALIVLKADGTIAFASGRAGDLVRRHPLDLVGESILEFVHPDDLARCAEILTFGRGYTQSIMGPVHVRYVAADGSTGYVDLWSNNCLDDPEIDGLVCVLNEETASSHLAVAVSAIAANRPIEETLRTVAEAMRGHPVESVGVMLGAIDGEVAPLTPTALADELCGVTGTRGPWHEVAETGLAVDVVDFEGLAPPIRDAAVAAGFESAWIRPVTVADSQDVHALLVVWSRLSGAPSPNQEDHLREGVSIASLAFGRVMLIDQLTHAATHDHLTGLGNRSKLLASVEATAPEPISVLYLDLDGFKKINDRLGHDAGDEVLIAVAERIAATLRSHDEVARVGGDEFIAVLRRLPSREVAAAVAERISMAVSHPIDVGGALVSVDVSIGIAHGTGDDGFAELVRQADAAMYEAKAAGGDHPARGPQTPRL